MRAAWYEQNGQARDVLVVGDLPTPSPKAGEVRVKVFTSGVNPSDIRFRKSRPLHWERIVPHSDGAGIVDAVGSGVSPVRLGERVWIWNGQWQRPMGTAAEYIAIAAEHAVALPAHVDFAAGACLGIPAMTGFHAVRMAGDIAGKTVLVIGASSSVGYYAAQVAAARGARVIGTAGSEAKARHALTAGIEATIEYKTEAVADRVKELTAGNGADVIIDMDLNTSVDLLRLGSLAPYGTLVSYGSSSPGDIMFPVQALRDNLHKLVFVGVYRLSREDRLAAIEGLGNMLNAGALRHVIGARFSLDRIADAHEAVEGGQLIGNVVVDVST